MTRTILKYAVALTLAGATALVVVLAFPEHEFVAGWVSALVFRDVSNARWLERNLNQWSGR